MFALEVNKATQATTIADGATTSATNNWTHRC